MHSDTLPVDESHSVHQVLRARSSLLNPSSSGTPAANYFREEGISLAIPPVQGIPTLVKSSEHFSDVLRRPLQVFCSMVLSFHGWEQPGAAGIDHTLVYSPVKHAYVSSVHQGCHPAYNHPWWNDLHL